MREPGARRDHEPALPSSVTFPCPLCLEFAARSRFLAELDPTPPLLIVTDLQGGCELAEAFGELEAQTLEEAWELIEAALDAASGDAS